MRCRMRYYSTIFHAVLLSERELKPFCRVSITMSQIVIHGITDSATECDRHFNIDAPCLQKTTIILG